MWTDLIASSCRVGKEHLSWLSRLLPERSSPCQNPVLSVLIVLNALDRGSNGRKCLKQSTYRRGHFVEVTAKRLQGKLTFFSDSLDPISIQKCLCCLSSGGSREQKVDTLGVWVCRTRAWRAKTTFLSSPATPRTLLRVRCLSVYDIYDTDKDIDKDKDIDRDRDRDSDADGDMDI